jgi:hypothetical protein
MIQNRRKETMDKNHEKDWGATEHAAIGAGVGAAGVAQSVALIGLAALPVLPVFIVVGALGGLAWWGAKKVAEK